MSDWFNEIAAAPEPGKAQLRTFVSNVETFLEFILDNQEDFAFLWNVDRSLLEEAKATFEEDVRNAAGMLRAAIENISESSLNSHGLQGRALRFKFRVLNAISFLWQRPQDASRLPGWLKQMLDAIDAILDSLIAAAGGAGGLIKEFKDALSALIPTSD